MLAIPFLRQDPSLRFQAFAVAPLDYTADSRQLLTFIGEAEAKSGQAQTQVQASVGRAPVQNVLMR